MMQKGRIMQEGRREHVESSERASGDLFGYFLLHNLISVLFFFWFTLGLGIYVERDFTLVYIISSEFWELTIFQIFPISLISSILGRITAFYGIKGYYRYRDRKTKIRRATKRWSEMNRKINRMGLRFLITALLTSFIYSFGMVAMLSYAVFDETTLLPLMVIYFVLKVGIYLSVRWFVGSKG